MITPDIAQPSILLSSGTRQFRPPASGNTMQHQGCAEVTRGGQCTPVQRDDQEPLGVLIRRARIRSGISQDALAERLGAVCGYTSLTRAAISHWERGVHIPQPHWRGYLSTMLDIPLEMLDQAAVQAARRSHSQVHREGAPAPRGGPAAGPSPACSRTYGPGHGLVTTQAITPNIVLQAWREARGLTRTQMAAALNQTPSAQQDRLACTPQLIGKWENGQIRWPTASYQLALFDLTGNTPGGLGFLGPTPHGPPPARPAHPAPTPSSPAASTGLAAIDDLTSLAATLHARGYTTSLAATVPRLTIGHPHAPQPITAAGPFFCWGQIPFGCRTPVSLAITADAVDVLMDLAITRQQDTA